MKLSCVLVACNENTKYLDFWPAVKEAWWKIAHLPCIMVYVGESLPNHLRQDPAVKFFKAVPGWPTATQAQCIRLLYPALLGGNDAVMISDMDMIPLQRAFFTHGFEPFNSNQFVSLRGIDEGERQVYMCYVGATPKVWGEIFNISTEQDITNRLTEWSQKYPADGSHGGQGWCSDQIELYQKVKLWQQLWPERVGLKPWTQEISRLCRSNPYEWMTYSDTLEKNLKDGKYVDFHMPPFEQFSSIIFRVLEAAWNPQYSE